MDSEKVATNRQTCGPERAPVTLGPLWQSMNLRNVLIKGVSSFQGQVTLVARIEQINHWDI